MSGLAVIVLAGGSVNERLRHLGVRAATPALLPVHTRSLASHVLDFYLTQPVGPVLLAVQREFAASVSAELAQYRGSYELVALPETRGVVESLARVLEVLPDTVLHCVVNVVTTVPQVLVAPGEVLVDEHPTADSAVAAVDLATTPPRILLKDEPHPEGARAFTGVFCMPVAVLRRAVASAPRLDDLAVVLRGNATSFREVPWIDCGHEVNFYNARAQLVASRSFNHLVVDRDAGVVRKRSSASLKLRAESEFMRGLPPAVSILFPRLVSPFREEGGLGEYAMEYYGYPNVAEYLLYWDLSPAMWRRIFGQLGTVLRQFARHKGPVPVGAYHQFYVERTHERVREYLCASQEDPRRAVSEGRLPVNGRPVRPLDDLLEEVFRLLVPVGGAAERGVIMHGDFCFNNILYDISSGIVRLIDPRGQFGPTPGIWGDQRYDAAKLMHSAVGRYDLVVNGLFDLEVSHGGVRFEIAHRPALAACESEMCELLADLKLDPRTIGALMALLFITMTPLHADAPRRQLVFFAHGLRLLTDLLN